ncbi:hypothetical protein, partial [Pseudocolwellia agarivorans]|uniref:hypothetical protein n=1 Tax=Pseudocolwellia agarivorans TaxID=1911682 RepID=UPI003F8838B1
ALYYSMKLPNRIVEIIFTYFMASPLLGIAYVLNSDVKAVVFWAIYFFLLFIFKSKLLSALKIGSFAVYFSIMLVSFVGLGWGMDYAQQNNLHNSGGVTFFMLPLLVLAVIYSKNSKSYRQAIDVFNKT